MKLWALPTQSAKPTTHNKLLKCISLGREAHLSHPPPVRLPRPSASDAFEAFPADDPYCVDHADHPSCAVDVLVDCVDPVNWFVAMPVMIVERMEASPQAAQNGWQGL